MAHRPPRFATSHIVAAALTKATGIAERTAAEEMIVRHSPGASRITLGADKGYDAASFDHLDGGIMGGSERVNDPAPDPGTPPAHKAVVAGSVRTEGDR
jgi:hypothetical protein